MAKHKTVNLVKGDEDPGYSIPLNNFLKLHTSLKKTHDDLTKFITALRSMSFACSELGADFLGMTAAGDPAGVLRCAEAYENVMHQMDESVRKPNDERLVTEVG